VLPFGIHLADLFDGIVGFLRAPVSSATRAELKVSERSATLVPSGISPAETGHRATAHS
jgi:hypothetical protein